VLTNATGLVGTGLRPAPTYSDCQNFRPIATSAIWSLVGAGLLAGAL